MAIIKRSESESGSAAPAEESIAVQELPPPGATAQASEPQTPSPEAAAGAVRSMTEALPSALEPELRRIIDTAVARVAAIELEAIREARELTQRSEQEARDALRFALDRAFNLINTLELLAATVGGMAEALKIELDDAIDALRNVPQPESELAKEMAQAAAPAPQPEPAPEPQQQAVLEAPAAPEPEPEPEKPAAAVAAPPVADAELQAEEAPAEEAPAAEAHIAEAPAEEEAPAPAAQTGNGYPPAQRQAESLAEVARDNHEPEPEPEPEPTAAQASSNEDGRPAVPARRRGLMRRLFSR